MFQLPKILFAPTVYEHAARLIEKTPSETAQNEELLVRGQLAAYKLYGQDIISVGLDIYNVEAEALGAAVEYYPDDRLPSLTGQLISDEADFERLRLPDPTRDGRMPLFVSAAKKIRAAVDGGVKVSGTVVGPYTLCVLLRGLEDFLMDMLDEPEFARRQLDFAARVGEVFALAYRDAGVPVVINESFIAPPLCSPELYREFALPYERRMIERLKFAGMDGISLICGGDTSSIIEDMLKTGTSLVMADWQCDRRYFKRLCAVHDAVLRAGIEPSAVRGGDNELMRRETTAVFADCADYEKFAFGCGIVSFDTPPENVLRLKSIFAETAARTHGSRS